MFRKEACAALLCGSVLISGCTGTAPRMTDTAEATAGAVSADLNCDGVADRARLLYPKDAQQVVVELTLGGDLGVSKLRFGLNDSGRQNALCGSTAQLEATGSDAAALKAIFGELPRGYRAGEQCAELVLEDGQCDSIHLYWDHARQHLNWWRL